MIAAFEVIFSCFVFIFDVKRGHPFSLSWKERLRRRKSLALYDTKRENESLGLGLGHDLLSNYRVLAMPVEIFVFLHAFPGTNKGTEGSEVG